MNTIEEYNKNLRQGFAELFDPGEDSREDECACSGGCGCQATEEVAEESCGCSGEEDQSCCQL